MIKTKQNTLKDTAKLTGIGLHSGEKVKLEIIPAPEDYGIVFRRSDVKGFSNIVRADYRNVSKTQLGTCISNDDGTMISTIEHLMAALWGSGIDNALIDVSGPEIPILDGSSKLFVKLFQETGIYQQASDRKIVQVNKEVEVRENDKFAKVLPSENFSIDLEIDFASKAISNQKFTFENGERGFLDEFSDARTFGFAHEVEYMRKNGLARGGSLENAIVIQEDKILNKEGLRYNNEFVRHKILDCIGDFYLAGKRISGAFKAYKTGHGLNNQLLRKLFADRQAYDIV
ncbi:MAG: UDP-3-O-acyl-N-acetylglucosamine deacetylase [Rickettsiales bacterium]|nr:UDP-3-O-acyl-N-acetylglucosamine deacetylase [Rickettsiales bacterium]